MFDRMSGQCGPAKLIYEIKITLSIVPILQVCSDIYIYFLQMSFCIFIDHFYNSVNMFVEQTLEITHIQSNGIVPLEKIHRENISVRCEWV